MKITTYFRNRRRMFVNKGQYTSVWGPKSTDVISLKIVFKICIMRSGSTYSFIDANLVATGTSWFIIATWLPLLLDRSTKVVYSIFSLGALTSKFFLLGGLSVIELPVAPVVKVASFKVMANRITTHC